MKRKMMTRFSAGCLALLLTFGSVCSVQAAQEPAEPNTGQETQTGQSPEQTVQTGSVTVHLTPGKEGTSVADVEFFLTKVVLFFLFPFPQNLKNSSLQNLRFAA